MAILTISREYGSGGREIGQAVAKLLNYEYVNKERLLDDIRALGKNWGEWGANLDEHCPTIWEKYDWSFRGFGALLENHILHYALDGNVVIMGRGGNFVLKGIPHALRIRVMAPLEQRAERIMKRETVDRETALWLMERTDKERSCLIHILYGGRWDDPEEYDMVFDTGAESIEQVTSVVKEELLKRERFNTDETGKMLYGRSVASKIKAAILTDPAFLLPTLDVHYDGASIILRGVSHDPKEHKRIEEAARKLSENIPLKCDLHYRR
ncbi:MAG TPA: cytidylate kinase-like family protein [Thermodesulfovibrionales bacterium]|nr:cytidylate kinase-like family protein [Thermodesulfovibrionales bacterium]